MCYKVTLNKFSQDQFDCLTSDFRDFIRRLEGVSTSELLSETGKLTYSKPIDLFYPESPLALPLHRGT